MDEGAAYSETAGTTERQLQHVAQELQPKLQAAMLQAGPTSPPLSDVSTMQEEQRAPCLPYLRSSVMSTQSAPGRGEPALTNTHTLTDCRVHAIC